MAATDTCEELVPLRTDFDVQLRGYDRDQVRHYVHETEAELRLIAADRDAAVACAENLARQLETARAEIDRLRARIDRICRTPVDPAALSERLRRMAELATEEAAEITARARKAAENDWTDARQAADRLRRLAAQAVADLDHRRRELETEHRALMDRARDQVKAMTSRAEQRRRELDAAAARLREQIQTDFELAMNTRRAEAMRAITEKERAADARAEDIVREATRHAHRILAAAREEVDVLRRQRRRVADELRAAQRLIANAEPLLRPLPEEARQAAA